MSPLERSASWALTHIWYFWSVSLNQRQAWSLVDNHCRHCASQRLGFILKASWLQQTWQTCYWGTSHDTRTTVQEWTPRQDRHVFTGNCECNEVRPIFWMLQHFTGSNTQIKTGGARFVAELRDGKSVTLVKLLRAKYCADSCDTRWTKPLPAACPSQRWWAFPLSLPSSASRLATSSSTHWASVEQVKDECGGEDDNASKWLKENVWSCESVARKREMRKAWRRSTRSG